MPVQDRAGKRRKRRTGKQSETKEQKVDEKEEEEQSRSWWPLPKRLGVEDDARHLLYDDSVYHDNGFDTDGTGTPTARRHRRKG